MYNTLISIQADVTSIKENEIINIMTGKTRLIFLQISYEAVYLNMIPYILIQVDISMQYVFS